MPRNSITRKSTYSYLFIILLFALALRLIYFFGILEGDDADYVFPASYLADHGISGLPELERALPYTKRWGLYAPAAFLFRILGFSEFSAAVFPLIASLATVYLVYKIAQLLVSEKAGLVASFLWAVFPLSIFLATQLDPEGPLTMTTTAAVYLILLATTQKQKPIKSLLYCALSVLFILWAFKIKESSAPIVFVLAALLAGAAWRSQSAPRSFWQRLPQRQKRTGIVVALLIPAIFIVAYFARQHGQWINGAELSATDISRLIQMGRTNPVRWYDIDPGKPYFTLTREPFTPTPSPNTLAAYPSALRFTLLDAYTPLLLLGISVLVLGRKRSSYFALTWLAILVFYLEWGPYPNGLGDILDYLPIPFWILADNLLYACVPMVLILGIYLSEQLKDKETKQTILWAVTVVLISVWFLENQATTALVSNIIAVCVLVISFFALVGPALLSGETLRQNGHTLIYAGLIVLVGVASLSHALHFHVSYFDWFIERRANLKAINTFLSDEPAYPISYPSDGLAGWLDTYNGYQYGYSKLTNEYSFPQTRLTSSMEQIHKYGGYILSEGCGQPVASFAAWPLAEFGNPEAQGCISLSRVLPAQQVQEEFLAARDLARLQPSQENISSYVAASASAGDLSAFIDGISHMVTFYPGDVPIVQASGIILEEGAKLPSNHTTDLLAQHLEGNMDWILGEQLDSAAILVDGTPVIEIQIDGSTQDQQPIAMPVRLRRNTAYILDLEFTAFAPIDFVRFLESPIPDSQPDRWSRELSWTSLQIIFITPSFSQETQTVQLELARIYDRGEVRFRKINLIEIRPND